MRVEDDQTQVQSVEVATEMINVEPPPPLNGGQ